MSDNIVVCRQSPEGEEYEDPTVEWPTFTLPLRERHQWPDAVRSDGEEKIYCITLTSKTEGNNQFHSH
jgi:hypothetical protein